MLIRRIIGTVLLVAVIAVVTAVHILAKREHATGVFACLNNEDYEKVHLTFGHHACFGGDQTSLDFVLTRGWQPNDPKSAEVRASGDAGHGLVPMSFDRAKVELTRILNLAVREPATENSWSTTTAFMNIDWSCGAHPNHLELETRIVGSDVPLREAVDFGSALARRASITAAQPAP